jgi:hypothetical protein
MYEDVFLRLLHLAPKKRLALPLWASRTHSSSFSKI